MKRKMSVLLILLILSMWSVPAFAYESQSGVASFDIWRMLSDYVATRYLSETQQGYPINLDDEELIVLTDLPAENQALLNTAVIMHFPEHYEKMEDFSVDRVMERFANRVFSYLFMFQQANLISEETYLLNMDEYMDLILSDGGGLKYHEEEYLIGSTEVGEWRILPISIMDSDGEPYKDQKYIYFYNVVGNGNGVLSVTDWCLADQEVVEFFRNEIREAIDQRGNIPFILDE